MGVADDILERVRRWIGLSAGATPADPSGLDPADAAGLDVPLVHDADAAPPPARRAALHVLVDEGLLRLADGRLALTREDGNEHVLALHEVAQVSIHGIAGITTPAIRALLAEGCPLIWRDRGGRYLGQVVDLSGRSTEVRRAQYAAQADAPMRLAVARAFVVAKIANTRGLLRRREVDRHALARLAEQARAATEAPDLPTLLGVEGAAAALAFSLWPALLLSASGFRFPGRRRRPATDPVNALLSYAYAVLVGECAAALLAAGLDLHAGFLHAERAGRPALALDLLEPLRALVADRVVLRLVNRGEVTASDFATAAPDAARPGAFTLSDRARRALLAGLEARLAEAAPTGEGWTYREAIRQEAAALAAALRAGTPYVCRLVRH